MPDKLDKHWLSPQCGVIHNWSLMGFSRFRCPKHFDVSLIASAVPTLKYLDIQENFIVTGALVQNFDKKGREKFFLSRPFFATSAKRLSMSICSQFIFASFLEQIDFDFCKVKALVPALNGQVNCPCAYTAAVCYRSQQSIFNVKML